MLLVGISTLPRGWGDGYVLEVIITSDIYYRFKYFFVATLVKISSKILHDFCKNSLAKSYQGKSSKNHARF